MRFIAVLAAALVAASVAVGAAGARATTYTIWAGEKSFPAPAPAPPSTTLNDFFPRTISIREGDRITIKNQGFHIVAYPGNVKPAALGLVLPDPQHGTYADTPNDFAGNPWWFEAMPKFIYNTLVLEPTRGVVKDKTTYVNSGGALIPQDPSKPGQYTFTFRKAGGYTLLCLVHFGMKLKVNVVGARSRAAAHLPTPAQVSAKGARQYAASYAEAAVLAGTKVPDHTVYGGIGDRTTLLAWLPDTITITAGQTVTFEGMSQTESHNPLFASDKDFADAAGNTGWLFDFLNQIDLFPFGPPGSPNQISPLYLYGTDPVGADGGYTFAGATQHGNGFFATPLVDRDPTTPVGDTVKVKFTVPGTYRYICELHGPDMSGTVIVQPAARPTAK